MAISSMIDDALDRYRADYGKGANVIYLGVFQIAALKAFQRAHDGGPVPPSEAKGFPNYDGIRIVEISQDSHLSVDFLTGDELPDAK